jgi:hypothetical protein
MEFDGAVVAWLFGARVLDVRGSVVNRGEAIEQDRCCHNEGDTNGHQR